MADKFVVPSNNTAPDLDGETDIEYIFTSDKVKGDPRGLTGAFTLSGKINVVLQKIINALAWVQKNQRVIPDADTDTKGIVEKATQDEAETATDNDKFVTPATSMAQLRHTNAQATETQQGTAKVATQAKVNAGTDDQDFVTSKKLRDFFFSRA